MQVSGHCNLYCISALHCDGQNIIHFPHVPIALSIPTLATVLKSCLGRSAPEEVVAVRAKERSVRSKRAMAPVKRVNSVRINLAKIKETIITQQEVEGQGFLPDQAPGFSNTVTLYQLCQG